MRNLIRIPFLVVSLAGLPLYGQIGRATITGIVSDSSGAVVPAVDVTAMNVETGVAYKTSTNEAGAYTVGALPVGQYGVTFVATGFREVSRRGLTLVTDQIARFDVTLELGQVAERVDVVAEAPVLQTETAVATKGVDFQTFSHLPLSFGGGRNMAEFADRLVPGVQGSSFTMKIQGTPGSSQSVVVDGMNNLSGFLPGDFAEASISPEAIQELSVNTGAVSAEYGRTGGGVLNFTLKSGTNQLHGTGFYYLRNEILNANDWNNNRLLAADPNFTSPTTRNFLRPQHRRFDKGVSVGGPVVIPKLYNGRDKTFFHFTLERFNRSEVGPTDPIRSVPQPEMFDGNLSRLLTGRQVGSDVLGRPVQEGQIYDPQSWREVNGQIVAEPFAGNIIPASRISQVARNFKPIFGQYYSPISTELSNNLYWTRYYKQVITQSTVKVDHSFSAYHKVSGFFYLHKFPRDFQDAGGLWSLVDPTYGGPLAKAMKQERRGHSWNANHDWVLTPSLLNHASLGVNVNKNFYGSRQAGQGYASQWGVKGVGLGMPEEKWTAPEFNLGSSPVVTFESWGKRDNRDFTYASYITSDTMSWQRRTHTLKLGVEYNRLTGEDFRFDNTGGVFSFSARTTAIPGQSYTSRIGNSFASFLLGEVDSGFLTPEFNTRSRRDYAAVFVQDTWKTTSRLTLTLGLRWSGNSPLYEKEDRIATFNPALPDPNGGNLRGAVEYMGTGPGRAGQRSPAPGQWRDLGPTFGLAYRVTNRVVLRAGYGITYTPETIGWNMIPQNFAAGFRPLNTLDADSAGIYRPVFRIDNGYPGRTTPPNLDPSWGQKRASQLVSPDYVKTGYIQHFNFGFQTEVAKDLLVEVEWRGSKGTRLHNWNLSAPNQIRKEELVRGAVLGQVIDTPQKAAAAGLPYPYSGSVGLGANTLMPFPQINTQSLSAWGDPIGFMTYHSGNLIVTKRMSRGTYLYGAYIFSKTISDTNDVTGWQGSSFGLQDAYDRRAYKQISPDDRTHRLKSAFLWELPVARKHWLLGHWAVSAILNYASGAPLAAPSSRTRPVGWNGPAVYANFNTPAGGFAQTFDPSRFNPWNASDPGNRFFDPSAFSDAGPQQLGTSPPRFPTVRGLWNFSEDMSVQKIFPIRERVQLQMRLELLNAFNRHYFGGAELNMNLAYFGNVRTASGARTGQFGMRVEW